MRPAIALRSTLLLFFVLVGAPPLAGQGRPISTIVLDRGSKEFTEPLSQFGGMRELRDGRILLVDMKEKELRLLDFTRDASTPVSRLGKGPLEFQVPGLLLGGRRDSILYFDISQRRFLLLSPTGKPIGTTPYGGADATALLSQMIPTSTDTAGHIYGQMTGMTMPSAAKGAAPEMPKFADSVDVMTLDRRTGHTTKLARIRNVIAQSQPKIDMVGSGVKLTMTAPDFRPSDAWAALPDGRVAILRDGVYRVHFITPGHPETLGPIVPYLPVPVTAAERKAVVDSLRKTMDVTMQSMRKSVGTAEGMPTIDIQILEPTKWATAKPAYTALLGAPDGRLWVSPSMPAGTKAMHFDVLDGTGALLAHVQLATGETLAGLGRNTVYTIRTDEDGLQHLRRYSLAGLL